MASADSSVQPPPGMQPMNQTMDVNQLLQPLLALVLSVVNQLVASQYMSPLDYLKVAK